MSIFYILLSLCKISDVVTVLDSRQTNTKQFKKRNNMARFFFKKKKASQSIFRKEKIITIK